MRMLLATCLISAALSGAAFADDDDDKGGAPGAKKPKMKFWNLTGVELVEVVMAPAGTDKFSANQTLNDDDKSVETDERVALVDIAAGKYDVRVKDKAGRVCLVKNVEVKDSGPYSFSLEADQLTDCKG
jgi:hypothetical protein